MRNTQLFAAMSISWMPFIAGKYMLHMTACFHAFLVFSCTTRQSTHGNLKHEN